MTRLVCLVLLALVAVTSAKRFGFQWDLPFDRDFDRNDDFGGAFDDNDVDDDMDDRHHHHHHHHHRHCPNVTAAKGVAIADLAGTWYDILRTDRRPTVCDTSVLAAGASATSLNGTTTAYNFIDRAVETFSYTVASNDAANPALLTITEGRRSVNVTVVDYSKGAYLATYACFESRHRDRHDRGGPRAFLSIVAASRDIGVATVQEIIERLFGAGLGAPIRPVIQGGCKSDPSKISFPDLESYENY